MSTENYWICSVCGKGVSRQPRHKELRVLVAVGWDHTRCHTPAVVQEPEELEWLSVKDAQKITQEIKHRVVHAWDLICEAYNRRAWSALGYDSWDSYTEAEFGDLRIRLPREERREVVSSLRESGLSIRAIASVTGVGRGTVERELAAVPNGTPDPEPNPKCTSHLQPPPGAPTAATPGLTPRVRDIVDRQRQPAEKPEPGKITGTDGKKYRKTAPRTDLAAHVKKLRRPALESIFSPAVRDLGRVIGRIAKAEADDRFTRNANSLARYCHELTTARDALNRVIGKLEAARQSSGDNVVNMFSGTPGDDQ